MANLSLQITLGSTQNQNWGTGGNGLMTITNTGNTSITN
jgi:hypothetical protein